MAVAKPSIPKGTRDFTPVEMVRREYIFDTIKSVFRLNGYQPIETPAMEHLSTLLGKYGEEGDKLLFRILNSGDFMAGITTDELNTMEPGRLSSRICEKGLRYDLTVPFARFVVQHQNEIVFPFKRYQIQPVWRADRPQKGRYREFFQCDVDVIGSDSLLNEAELIRIIDEVFDRLKIRVVIKLNNRKILSGIAEISGASDKITDITVAIDKLEKIGLDAVLGELKERGIPGPSLEKLVPVIKLEGSRDEKLGRLSDILAGSATGLQGVAELKKVFSYIDNSAIRCKAELDLTLARGLNYYTGAIIEVKASDVAIGSICGGGRYDNLTGIFGLEGVSGVGVSFGADRIYDVLSQLGMFGEERTRGTKALVINFGEQEIDYALKIASALHQNGINAEVYPDTAKIKKQMSYADSRGIPFVLMAGSDEIASGEVTVKDMKTGEQKKVSFAGLPGALSN
ncbi:MAG: histidine--tRNA ligase [Bacteroidales bacterium]